MDMKITFPQNQKVAAHYHGFTIQTDQKKITGGDETAPEPFSLFLASIGTCTGIYVLRFLQERKLSTEQLYLHLTFRKNTTTHLIDKIEINIHTPADFPKKYHNALIKTANLCAVKKHLEKPPEIHISILED